MNESPTNTSSQDPLVHLVEAIASPDTFITDMEARGQKELLASEVLPSEILWCTQEDMEALGFVFGDLVKNDPLFRHVTLPQGWSRKGTEHSMWTAVVDERGIERVAVFYKAAFYDRSARMGLNNVGRDVAQNWIYGDDEDLKLHPELTDEEKAGALSSAMDYIADAEEHPDIYGARLPRAQMLVERLR